MIARTFILPAFLILAGEALAASPKTFMVSNTFDSGPGSMRQAISDANTNPGPDIIQFNIPGTGVQTNTTISALPAITDPVTIDGTSQPNYAGLPLIHLNGNFKAWDGLYVAASNCTIKALSLGNFGSSSSRRSGIVLAGFGGHRISGCLLGTTSTGTAAERNSLEGILVSNSCCNIIGGTTAADRNVVSGNSYYGIALLGSGCFSNVICGNYIGLSVGGSNAIPNGSGGVLLSNAPNNTVGGTVPGAGNVISGNTGDQLSLFGSGSSENLVAANIYLVRSYR